MQDVQSNVCTAPLLSPNGFVNMTTIYCFAKFLLCLPNAIKKKNL